MIVNNSLEIVILAAGQSSRFGGIKALADFRGKTFIQRAISRYTGISNTTTTVVLGAYVDEIVAKTNLEGVKVITNVRWRSGMSTSIQAAVDNAGRDSLALLFVAVDQVLIEKHHLETLIDSWLSRPESIVAASYDDEVGIPAIFPRAGWKTLAQLTGDEGAKRVLLRASKLTRVPLPEAATDVDTREELNSVCGR